MNLNRISHWAEMTHYWAGLRNPDRFLHASSVATGNQKAEAMAASIVSLKPDLEASIRLQTQLLL
ncbi:MAG: hypothetical protein ACU88J_01400 [Gammaproteobacteria bacterium]